VTDHDGTIRYYLQSGVIIIDNTGQQISKTFVSVMNMLLIYLLASMKIEKGHKKITWL